MGAVLILALAVPAPWQALEVGRGKAHQRADTPRAIVQFEPGAGGCVLEGFELTNARNRSSNGAGVRINQANDVVVRRCDIHHNGSQRRAGFNHNLYLGGTSVRVTAFEIYALTTGHNYKSRAHYNWVETSFIHDSANGEFDIVDGAGNTDSSGSHAVLPGVVRNGAAPSPITVGGNWISAGFLLPQGSGLAPGDNIAAHGDGYPPFRNPAANDYKLIHANPHRAIYVGQPLAALKLPVPPGDLNPPANLLQYKHPLQAEPRPAGGRPDAGAYEASKP